jgi:MoaA/NifB/PqqE/SkfB family radical SAM enzyme
MEKHNRYFSAGELARIWKRIYDKYGECHIMITGGEPTSYPDFIDVVFELSKMHTIKVTSQLSGDMESFASKLDPGRVVLDMNFHPLEAEFESYVKKVLLLKSAGFKGGVCYLAYPPQMDKIDYYNRKFSENGISFALAAFWGEYNGKKYPDSYTDEEKEMMKPFLGDISRVQYHLNGQKTKGKLCRAGNVYASIKADGTVTRCGPLSHKPIGNLFDNNFRLFSQPMPCEAEVCPCDEYKWLV